MPSFSQRTKLSLAPVFAALLALSATQIYAQAHPVAMTPEQVAAATPTTDQTWWKHATFYEIYPRSFQDSNGDGVGDLNGITNRLDYLKQLGVDAVWIAPMYPSPQVDFGYDISDYESVDPQYGTVADMDRLIAEGKKRNIRMVLDMVLNHTSDKHQWFIESAKSRTNPKADWYVWNDGKPADSPDVNDYERKYEHEGMHGKVVPPNNWVSIFGGSAWEWVPARKQYYYHKFYKQQPDLNWTNPAVEKAAFDAMRFWLDRGIAGFRLDAIPTLFEDPKLRDEPAEGGLNKQGDPNLKDIYTSNLPEVHDVIRRMRAMVEKYPGNRVLIGETYLPDTAELNKWYGDEAKNELQLPMDFLVGFGPGVEFSAPYFRKYIEEVETEVHGSQPLLVFDNHDNVRSMDRFGDGTHNKAIAQVLATVLLTPKASALMYYGEELGMPTTTPTRVEDVKDPIGVTGWPKEKGRDGERTPMQWDTSNAQAGFSPNAKTWLPVPANYKTLNVKSEEADPKSLLHWFTQLLALRHDNAAIKDGGMVMLTKDSPAVLSFVRTAPAGAKSVLVAMNLSAQPQTVTFDLKGAGVKGTKAKTLMASEDDLKAVSSAESITLPPFSSWVAEVE